MTNTSTSGTTLSNLSLEGLKAILDEFMPKKSRVEDFFPFQKPSFFGGLNLHVSPYIEPRQKIKVRDIKFSDGTSILSAEFLAKENQWWKEQFGVVDEAYIFGNQVFVNPKTAALIRNFT